MYFKAFIRVVKSLNDLNAFDSVTIVKEKLIEATDKNEVKQKLIELYPQFFPEKKIFEKETKDKAQFFYVIIYPLLNWELQYIEEGAWTCSHCGQVHENKYISKPYRHERQFGDHLFCLESDCADNFKKEMYRDIEFPDDITFIKKDSPNYIYKCTEKSSGKCYIGKTKNAPMWRWWNHLTHSSSPFGRYLRITPINNWTFEVLDILSPETPDSEVFNVESKYILQYDSINNGFNTVISKKQNSHEKEV